MHSSKCLTHWRDVKTIHGGTYFSFLNNYRNFKTLFDSSFPFISYLFISGMNHLIFFLFLIRNLCVFEIFMINLVIMTWSGFFMQLWRQQCSLWLWNHRYFSILFTKVELITKGRLLKACACCYLQHVSCKLFVSPSACCNWICDDYDLNSQKSLELWGVENIWNSAEIYPFQHVIM